MASVGEALAEERGRGARLESDLAAAQATGAASQAGLEAETAQRTELEGKVCAQILGRSFRAALMFPLKGGRGDTIALFLCVES